MSITHSELVSIASKWLKQPHHNATKSGHGRCALVIPELVTSAGEIPDVIGWYVGKSIMIECKTSRQDFKRDEKKQWRGRPENGVGVLRFYLCPEGIIKPDEIPENWGLLYTDGKNVSVHIDAKPLKADREKEVFILLSYIRRNKIKHMDATS